MNKALVFGIAGGAILLGIGVAAAASPAAPTKRNPAVDTALSALRTGDKDVIKNAGVSLATTNAPIAAGLVRTYQFLESMSAIPSDVAAMARASVRTTDPKQMLGVASVMQTKNYPTYALTLRELSKFVQWLLEGAPGQLVTAQGTTSVASGTVPAAASIPTGVTLPSTVPGAVQVALPNAATTPMTTQEAQDIANVIATGDPGKIRAKAGEYKAKGRSDIGDALNEAANQIESAISSGKPLPSINPADLLNAAQAAGVPSANPTPQVNVPPASAQKTLAAKVALALKGSDKSWKGTSREPRSLVQMFQVQENLTRKDGSYGSETALALAERYGIVPPKPLYWGAKGGSYKTLQADQELYRKRILLLGSKDAARVDEWTLAAKV